MCSVLLNVSMPLIPFLCKESQGNVACLSTFLNIVSKTSGSAFFILLLVPDTSQWRGLNKFMCQSLLETQDHCFPKISKVFLLLTAATVPDLVLAYCKPSPRSFHSSPPNGTPGNPFTPITSSTMFIQFESLFRLHCSSAM